MGMDPEGGSLSIGGRIRVQPRTTRPQAWVGKASSCRYTSCPRTYVARTIPYMDMPTYGLILWR
eukprot:scaffold2311_cov313-Pavlova_lutheri.AAC.4